MVIFFMSDVLLVNEFVYFYTLNCCDYYEKNHFLSEKVLVLDCHLDVDGAILEWCEFLRC